MGGREGGREGIRLNGKRKNDKLKQLTQAVQWRTGSPMEHQHGLHAEQCRETTLYNMKEMQNTHQ